MKKKHNLSSISIPARIFVLLLSCHNIFNYSYVIIPILPSSRYNPKPLFLSSKNTKSPKYKKNNESPTKGTTTETKSKAKLNQKKNDIFKEITKDKSKTEVNENDGIVSILKSFGLLNHIMNIQIPTALSSSTSTSDKNMNNIVITELYTNKSIQFGILSNITNVDNKVKFHVILLNQFIDDDNDMIQSPFDISQILSLWSTTTTTDNSSINKITIPSIFILKSLSNIYEQCKQSVYPSEKAMQSLYKSRIGRGRNVFSKKDIKNVSNDESIQMVLRTSLKAGEGMKRLIRSSDVADVIFQDDADDIWKQIENRMISSLIINNDIVYGGRFKRFPSQLVYNNITTACILNGGYITLDSSTRVHTETDKFIQRSNITTPADERIYYKLECFAMSNDNNQNIELHVKTLLSRLNLPSTPSGAKQALLQMGKWSTVNTTIQPWSSDIITASKSFITHRKQQNINSDTLVLTDLRRLPSICIDSKTISFRDDAIGIRPRSSTNRPIIKSAYPNELLLHITDVSDIFCSQEEFSNVLLNAASSRGFSRYDLSLGPLHLLPVNVLKELSLQYSISYDGTTKHNYTSWKDLLSDEYNKCITIWVYIDKTTGELLDYGIERSMMNLPIAMSFDTANQLLAKQQNNKEGNDHQLKKDISSLLTIIQKMLNSYNTNQSLQVTTAAPIKNKKRQEKIRIKEIISEQMLQTKNKFEYTPAHQLVDTSLELYSFIINQLFEMKRREDKQIYPLPYNNMLKSSSSSDGRLGTAPLRRYIDGMIQRQIISVFFDKSYLLSIDDCKRITKITMDTFAIQKSNTMGLASASVNKAQYNALRALEQHLATSGESRNVKAMATGRSPNEVVIVDIGAIAKCRGVKGTLKPGRVVLCRVLKLVPEKGILSVQYVN